MTNVVRFTGVTCLDLNPDMLLQEAVGQLESVVILGYAKDGGEYFASSKADAGEVVWHLERAKYKLLKHVDDVAGDA